MSSVGGSDISSRVGQALDGKGKWDEAANTIGKKVSSAEEDMLLAYSLSESNVDDIQDLASSLGKKNLKVTAENAQAVLESLQIMAKNKYERAQRSMATLVQIISNAHTALMRIIQNIRAN